MSSDSIQEQAHAVSMIISSPASGNVPHRLVLVTRGACYVIFRENWLHGSWQRAYPCTWRALTSDISLARAQVTLQCKFRDDLLGLLSCAYEFSVTKELPCKR